jgi:hypothetical protein
MRTAKFGKYTSLASSDVAYLDFRIEPTFRERAEQGRFDCMIVQVFRVVAALVA